MAAGGSGQGHINPQTFHQVRSWTVKFDLKNQSVNSSSQIKIAFDRAVVWKSSVSLLFPPVVVSFSITGLQMNVSWQHQSWKWCELTWGQTQSETSPRAAPTLGPTGSGIHFMTSQSGSSDGWLYRQSSQTWANQRAWTLKDHIYSNMNVLIHTDTLNRNNWSF